MVFEGLAGLLRGISRGQSRGKSRGAAQAIPRKPRPSRLFYLDLNSILGHFGDFFKIVKYLGLKNYNGCLVLLCFVIYLYLKYNFI